MLVGGFLMFMLDEGIKVFSIIQKVANKGFYKETQLKVNK